MTEGIKTSEFGLTGVFIGLVAAGAIPMEALIPLSLLVGVYAIGRTLVKLTQP